MNLKQLELQAFVAFLEANLRNVPNREAHTELCKVLTYEIERATNAIAKL
jgi:hypothetical protein